MSDETLGRGSRARGYSWAPFEAGNAAALKHGAGSSRVVAPIAAPLLDSVAEIAPWAARPAFAGTLRSWAWAEGQAQILRSFLREHGPLDEAGEERPAARALDRVEGRLAKLRDQLGLTPTSLAKLLASAAAVATATGDEVGVEALQAEGRQILAARLMATTTDDNGTDDNDDATTEEP